MIEVDVIPDGCTCGWLAMGYDDGADAPWRLTKPEPTCPHPDHHAEEPAVQLTLDSLPEWEIRP